MTGNANAVLHQTRFQEAANDFQEAFVVNNAQVCVLLSDDESLLVGAQVFAVQEALPITQEELKAGLVEIARKVVSEL